MFKISAYINYTWFPPSELLLIRLQRSQCSMLYVHWACFCKLLIAHCQLWTLTVPDLVVWWYTQVRSGLRLWKSGKHFNLQPAIRNIFSSLARAVNMLASVFKQLICHTQLRKMIAGIHLGTWYMMFIHFISWHWFSLKWMVMFSRKKYLDTLILTSRFCGKMDIRSILYWIFLSFSNRCKVKYSR